MFEQPVSRNLKERAAERSESHRSRAPSPAAGSARRRQTSRYALSFPHGHLRCAAFSLSLLFGGCNGARSFRPAPDAEASSEAGEAGTDGGGVDAADTGPVDEGMRYGFNLASYGCPGGSRQMDLWISQEDQCGPVTFDLYFIHVALSGAQLPAAVPTVMDVEGARCFGGFGPCVGAVGQIRFDDFRPGISVRGRYELTLSNGDREVGNLEIVDFCPTGDRSCWQ